MTTTAIDLDFTKPPALAMAEDTEATKQGEGVVEAGVSRSTLEEGKRTVVSEVEVGLLGSPVRGGDLGGSGEGEENLSARGIRDGLGGSDEGKEKVSYSDALQDALRESDRYKPEFTVKDGVADVSIPEELMEDVEPLWKCFVVGYFMSDSPHIGTIHSTVNRIWSTPGKGGKIDVQFIAKKIVLFRVEDALMRNRIIKRKFWHISDIPLVLNEWTPESAKAPPDLFAMPLWVDLSNVPGYLYSNKGLSFLSRTAGKFVKLHPNTEKCIRLDVARVLVEVDLEKPLPHQICFRGRDDQMVTVQVSYPWLPPACARCAKWGHNEKDCQVEKIFTILEKTQEDSQVEARSDEGNVSNQRPGKEENLPALHMAAVEDSAVSSKEMSLFINNLSDHKESESWVTIGAQTSQRSSPVRQQKTVEKVVSPNEFQILQNFPEKGEIVEGEDGDNVGEEAQDSELNMKEMDGKVNQKKPS